jgi:hypothetical protein
LKIRELHVVAEVTLLLKGFSLRTKSLRVGKNLLANTVSQIGCFLSVKYQIEALNMLYPTVRGQSAQFIFWSGQRLGQTSVKLGQLWSNLVKPREMCFEPCLEVLLTRWTPFRSTLLGTSCPVLRTDTQENPGGKNRVMTLATPFSHRHIAITYAYSHFSY